VLSFFNSLAWRESYGDHSLYFTEWFPSFQHGRILSQIFASAAALFLVILPSGLCLLGYRKSSLKNIALVSSAALFAVLFLVGILFRIWSIYYVGSVVCALIFFVAIYIEIHFLNQTASVVKEELRKRVNKGDSGARVSELIESLENFSEGNIDLYKLRIREVLCVLTDDTIASGGDAKTLLERNNVNLRKIEDAKSAELLTEITENEAKKISHIIENIPKQRRREVVEQAKAYIIENLDSDLTIDVLANQLHVSRSYLTTAFKEQEGLTINQLITQMRIEKAKLMLKGNQVTDVAFKVGYNNSNYFSTVFKKVTGMTPKEYQNGLGEG